jgi:glycolate oxidase iron-sulfur subunit
MRAVSEGDLSVDSQVLADELDFCLGCLACTTACPAGVDYGALLEAGRDQLARRHMAWWQKLPFKLFERPGRLRYLARLLWLYQRSGLQWAARASGVLRLLKLEQAEGMLPPVPFRSSYDSLAGVHEAYGPARARVGVLLGCVMDVLFGEENRATVEVLRRNGCTVVVPPSQGCCGALHAHAGQLEGARKLSVSLVQAFEGCDVVAVNSAGCGACMKHHCEGMIVRDVHELLVELRFSAPSRPLPGRFTYHDACHLAHGQRVTTAPREVMRAACSEYVELPRADRCCGSAGIYNLTHPGPAGELLADKLDAIESTGASVVGVANPGCLLQIRQGLQQRGSRVRAEHPVVLLARAYEQAPG